MVRQLAVWQATFAGGFVPVRMTLSVALTVHGKESQWQVVQEAFPKDGNMPQTFQYVNGPNAASIRRPWRAY